MQVTYGTKAVLAQRLQFAEFGAPVTGPTVIDVRATAALAGPLRDRVGRGSRYLAARLAMARQGIQDVQIAPTEVPGKRHRADGFTKPLVGEALRVFAAQNQGLDTRNLVPPVPTRAGGARAGASRRDRGAEASGGAGADVGGGRTGPGRAERSSRASGGGDACP